MTALVNPYILGPAAFDITAFSYASKSFDFTSRESNAWTFAPGDSGNKGYMVGTANDTAFQYAMATPNDVATLSYASKSYALTGLDPFVLFFKPDGSKVFVSSNSGDEIQEHTLSTPWDISTAADTGNTLDVSAKDISPRFLAISEDGDKLFVGGPTSDAIHEYSLGTAWSLGGSNSFVQSLSISSFTGVVGNGAFVNGGRSLILPDAGDGTIYQLNGSTPWDISTYTDSGNSLAFTQGDSEARAVRFDDDEEIMFVLDGSNRVYQFAI